MPIARRPKFFAATSVVPPPANGSSSSSPAALHLSTTHFMIANFLPHGCSDWCPSELWSMNRPGIRKWPSLGGGGFPIFLGHLSDGVQQPPPVLGGRHLQELRRPPVLGIDFQKRFLGPDQLFLGTGVEPMPTACSPHTSFQ